MSSCIPVASTLQFGINIGLHVLILFTFLTAFFILFVSKLSTDTFNNEIGGLIDKNVGNMIDTMDPTTRTNLALYMKNVPIDKAIARFQQPSDFVAEHNKWVKWASIGAAIIGLCLIVIVISLLYKNCGQCMPLGRIVMENMVVFAFVGVVEYLFFVNVAFKFVPAPPSLLVNSMVDQFKTSLVQQS